MLISKWLAAMLKESPLSADENVVPEGKRVRLTATLTDSWQLDWWTLSYADAIKILEPTELRKRISKTFNTAARQYWRK